MFIWDLLKEIFDVISVLDGILKDVMLSILCQMLMPYFTWDHVPVTEETTVSDTYPVTQQPKKSSSLLVCEWSLYLQHSS